MTDHEQRLASATDALISDGEALLAPLGSQIWHGQTLLHDAESTRQVTSFLVRFRAVADAIGGEAARWRDSFPVANGSFDVNSMRQALGALAGFKTLLEHGLVPVRRERTAKLRDDDAVGALETLLKEGRAILDGIVLIPGAISENWFTHQSSRGPDREEMDWERFCKWKADAAARLEVVIPTEHSLRSLIKQMRSLTSRRDHLEWGIAQLDSVRDSCEKGLLAPRAPEAPALHRVLRILDRFHVVAKQLERRHSNRATVRIVDEYDVQDLLHSLLSIDFDDIREEEPTPSCAGKSSRMDLMLKSERIVVEAKMTREGLADKELGSQLLEDISRYDDHPDCECLICFVYDPARKVRNRAGLVRDLERRSTSRLKVFIRVVPE